MNYQELKTETIQLCDLYLESVERLVELSEYIDKNIYKLLEFPSLSNYSLAEIDLKDFIDFVRGINTKEIVKRKAEITEPEELNSKYLSLIRNHLNSGRQIYQNTLNFIHISFLKKTSLTSQERSQFDTTLFFSPSQFKTQTSQWNKAFYLIIPSIEQLDIVKNRDENIVFIGANGSGKTTFSKALSAHAEQNLVSIPAQRLMTFGTKTNNPPIFSYASQQVYNYHKSHKMYGKSNDLDNLVYALMGDQIKVSQEYRTDPSSVTGYTILERTIGIWNEINIHRKLYPIVENYILKVKYKDLPPYDAENLSDGEKDMFYCIGHTLFAKDNSFVVIDEPEIHLNLSVVSKMWDILEKERSDCQFLYLTHNKDFACSRKNASILWIKEYEPQNSKWIFQPIKDLYQIPEILLIELLGSRKNILFCEGTKSSTDFKVYSLLFPEYTIMPVGGHKNVISYCDSYNDLHSLHNLKAIGIIDGDYHSEEKIQKYLEKRIYVLPLSEIENLLCDEILLSKAQLRFCVALDSIEKAKSALFLQLKQEKEKNISFYVSNKIQDVLEDGIQEKTKQAIETEVKRRFDSLKIDQWYNERSEEIDKILSEKDYSNAMRLVNHHSIAGIVGSQIENKYYESGKNDGKIITLMSEDEELCLSIRAKYFSETTT